MPDEHQRAHSPPVQAADSHRAGALPFNPREGVATIPTGEYPALVAGKLYRTILSVALPAVAASLLMTVFATADAFWVGTRIGPDGLAAVSTAVFWIWMLVALAEMVSVGLTAVAARRHGESRPEEAARAVGDALVLSLTLGVLVALVGVAFLGRMFATMHDPLPVAALGRSYLGAYLIGTPLIFGFFAVDAGFRASGDTLTPFLLLAASVAVALVLDPVLLLGLGPAPRLGIAGAAVATIVPRGIAFLAGLELLRRRGLVRFGRVRLPTVLAVVRIGLPTALTGVTFSLIYVLLTRTTTHFGTPALAALGVGHRVESWAYMIGVGFGAASAAIVAQNIGAGQVRRAERAGWMAMGFASIVSAVACLAEFHFAIPFASFFTHEADVIAVSANYLRIAALSTLFIGAELVFEGSLGGAGETLPPMLSSTTLTVIRLPLAAWAAPRYGVNGIWWTISLTAAARGIAMMALWRSGIWKRRAV